MNLHLAQHPLVGDTETKNLTPLMQNWVRSSYTIGGQWIGTGTVADNIEQLAQYYNEWLGMQVVEYDERLVVWRGMITEMRLTINGVEFFISLDDDWFANEVTGKYSAGIASRNTTSTYTNDESQDVFGVRERWLSMGGATATSSAAYVQKVLEQIGYPRSRATGGMTASTGRRNRYINGLQVTARGFWNTLNWKHKESTSTSNASTHVSDAVTASQFITDSEVDDNTLSVRLDAFPNPKPWGDALIEVTAQGDSSNDQWECGIYGKKLYYNQAPDTVTHYISKGRLYDLSGNLTNLKQLKPGFMARLMDAPVGFTQSGGEVWDDPTVTYVQGVIYDHDINTATLETVGEDGGILSIAAQVAAGNAEDRSTGGPITAIGSPYIGGPVDPGIVRPRDPGAPIGGGPVNPGFGRG